MDISLLQKARYEYKPKLPKMLRAGTKGITVHEGEKTEAASDKEKIAALFPKTYGMNEVYFVEGESTAEKKKHVIGVILSGGQAPGGHNVIAGLYDAMKEDNPESILLGFKGGPSGLVDDNYITTVGIQLITVFFLFFVVKNI